MAIMMGLMVCTTSKWSAFLRDLKFKFGRMLGKLPASPPAYPPISEGLIVSGSAAAGSYFPQAIADNGARLDAYLAVVLGYCHAPIWPRKESRPLPPHSS